MGFTRLTPSKPTIAAISGFCLAGGLEIALWCDLRIAAEGSTLGYPERRWGVPLIDGGTVRLPQVIGMGRALDLILTGRAVAAPEALDIGLVNRLAPTGTVRAAAEQLARQIAGLPQGCLRSDRASVLEGATMGFGEAMANEFRHGMTTLADPDVIVGVSRFRGGAGRGGAPA
jgi:enoyl-CoA hydratase